MTAITVTAQHIDEGVRESCENCPIALAIMEAFPGACYAAVGPGTCTIGAPDGSVTEVDLPESALNFIWDFDDGGHPKPFTFTVDYPAAAPASGPSLSPGVIAIGDQLLAFADEELGLLVTAVRTGDEQFGEDQNLANFMAYLASGHDAAYLAALVVVAARRIGGAS